MTNGMIGLVRARQSLWLTEDMAHEISHRTGLPLDDGTTRARTSTRIHVMETAEVDGRRFWRA